MKLEIYSVYDSIAEAYITPFFLPNEGMALRTFGDMVNDQNHQFGKHPDQYTLFFFGEFDVSQGEFALENKVSLGNGVAYVLPTAQILEIPGT